MFVLFMVGLVVVVYKNDPNGPLALFKSASGGPIFLNKY
jgi:hypothetical protein